jgi:hypothetical protein
MVELVQITAQYSNAVLVAVLPYISDFAQKLELPVKTPIAATQVSEFRCDPRKGEIGGLVTLTNGARFGFSGGHVSSYRSPESYFSLQDPALIPRFYGRVKLSEKQALNTAHDVIRKLGYSDDTFRADLPPTVTKPEKIGVHQIARYRFQWMDANWTGSREAIGIVPALLDVEVNASNGQVTMVSVASAASRRPPPKVDVSPPLMKSESQANHHHLAGGTQTAPVSPLYAASLLRAVLPELSDFAAKLRLQLRSPLTTNDVDLSKYHCRILEGRPFAQIFLKSGDRFNFDHGHFTAFYGHNAYRKFPENGRLEDFTGEINVTTNEAISLCETVIKDLGYKAKLPKGVLGSPARIGNKDVTRCVFYWWKRGEDVEFASFEVDMQTKAIKSAYLDDTSLWREPPKIEVPMTEEAIPGSPESLQW